MNHFLISTRLIFSLFALAAILSNAGCTKGPSVVREIIVSEGVSGGMTPHTIVQTVDGGLLIAGDADQNAFAIKTDIQGKTLWRHVVYLRDREKLSIGNTATYAGSASMADGSTYLCGSMPSVPGTYGYGILSHIDHSGNVLNEQFVGPSNIGPNVILTLASCERWGDRVVVLGKIFEVVRVATGNDLGQASFYYWVGAFGSNGALIWERIIPTHLTNIDEIGPVQVLPDQSIIFSGTRILENSELFHLDTQGNILDESNAFRQISMIKNVSDNLPIRIISSAPDLHWSLISLNIHFQEQARINLGIGDDKFYKMTSFSLTNNSVSMFGSSIHNFGDHYSSAQLWFDPSLRSHHKLDLNIGPYRDHGQIEAAAHLADGEFVVARHLNSDVKGEGLALDFIAPP